MCSQRIGVAETAVQKHYECVTVVCELQRDMERYVADDRQERSLEAFYAELGPSAFTGLDMIAMDKLHPDIAAIRAVVPEADRELGFDHSDAGPIGQVLPTHPDVLRAAHALELLPQQEWF